MQISIPSCQFRNAGEHGCLVHKCLLFLLFSDDLSGIIGVFIHQRKLKAFVQYGNPQLFESFHLFS